MRRLILPAVVLVVAITASVLAGRADQAADAGDGSGETTAPALRTPLFSVRRAPEWLRRPTTDALLARGVEAALSTVAPDTPHCLSVHRDGTPVAEINPTTPLTPGALQRLVTISAFEPDAPGFTTEVVRPADAEIVDGVLQGDLYLIGGADPVLSTPAFIERFGDGRAFTPLPELAIAVVQALAEQGITEVAGAVVGTDLKYASDRPSNTHVDGTNVWTSADIATNEVGRTDGLLLDNGFASFDPEVVDPSARVRADDPQAHAATGLAAWIEFGGISITGGARSGSAPEIADRIPVASIESPAMVDIARRALVDATTAEMLYRELAVRSGWPGDLPLGAAIAVSNALVANDIIAQDQVGNYPAWDGSGLSLRNAGQCAALTAILDGRAGTMAPDALAGLGAGAVEDCAPSGLASLDVVASARPEVTALAGSATATNGDVITFALIVNWLPDERGDLPERGICDDVVPAVLDAIADHPGGPDLAELAPLPVAVDAAEE